jgi:hypothetical protein
MAVKEAEKIGQRMNRNRLVFVAAIAAIIIFIILGVVLLRFVSRRSTSPSGPPASARRGRILPGTPGPLPEMSTKPQPAEIDFQGCPGEGDNPRQADLNRLKNRVDEGDYVPVAFDSIVNLPWPQNVERLSRDKWSASDLSAVEKYEGVPVAVEGYLAGARQEGPESPNCHGDDQQFRDFHVWLVKNANDDRSHSIVVEVTPRVRANHPKWQTDALGQIVKKDERVRISGWLMLDPEHPDQVGKTRGTIWEVHPITQIEVQQSGKWIPLDDFGG